MRFLQLFAIACFYFAMFGDCNGQGPQTITNSIGMKFVRIPKGSFMMGSPPTEEGSFDEERQHEVTLTKGYYLGVFEVTQAQYERVMGINPSEFQGERIAERIPAKKHPITGRTIQEEQIVPVDSSDYPVEQVQWKNAVEFCKKLSELPVEKKAGRVYRLPTEAEWEYACRAGSKTAYSFGDSSKLLSDYAWFGENSGIKRLDSQILWNRLRSNRHEYHETIMSSGGSTHPVGGKKPNAWGLYDMHGNVWEWCSDWYGDYPKDAEIDPVGPVQGDLRVCRGGNWYYVAELCRSSARYAFNPSDILHSYYGFRVAMSESKRPR
jgi:formylglycine-generating enzyme required for sulfatase activity